MNPSSWFQVCVGLLGVRERPGFVGHWAACLARASVPFDLAAGFSHSRNHLSELR